MENHRYILEPYKGPSTRHTCPACGKRKEFARYINEETDEYLTDHVGRCNREINCGYHLTPSEYFLDSGQWGYIRKPVRSVSQQKPQPQHEPSYISDDVYRQSRQHYDRNNFIIWLYSLFDRETVTKLTTEYSIGTSKHWSGATVFWQVATAGKVRTGKIMLYDQVTGKRRKDGKYINWVHSVLKIKEFRLQQCLFGLPLLKQFTDKLAAIVESEKTAIIASIYLPQFVWLACGSLSNIKQELFEPLCGRRIVLFPDLGAYDKWREKTDRLKKEGFNIVVSDYLEKNAPEADRQQGYDIADYLIQYPVSAFVTPSLVSGTIQRKKLANSPNIEAKNRVIELWMPKGWYYDVWRRYDGVEVKTLINGTEGCPAGWVEPKSPKEASALMIDRNPAMVSMIDRLDLVPESFSIQAKCT